MVPAGSALAGSRGSKATVMTGAVLLHPGNGEVDRSVELEHEPVERRLGRPFRMHEGVGRMRGKPLPDRRVEPDLRDDESTLVARPREGNPGRHFAHGRKRVRLVESEQGPAKRAPDWRRPQICTTAKFDHGSTGSLSRSRANAGASGFCDRSTSRASQLSTIRASARAVKCLYCAA